LKRPAEAFEDEATTQTTTVKAAIKRRMKTSPKHERSKFSPRRERSGLLAIASDLQTPNIWDGL
jgi:hypothetical protein